MGASKAMTPNRLSFFLGVNGPSVNIDSGDTGSGTALEKAYHALKKGQCEGAIVAGVSECLHPHLTYQLKKLGKLSYINFELCDFILFPNLCSKVFYLPME